MNINLINRTLGKGAGWRGAGTGGCCKRLFWGFWVFFFLWEMTQTLGRNCAPDEKPWGEVFTGLGIYVSKSRLTCTCLSQHLNKWPNPSTYPAARAEQMSDFSKEKQL